LNAALIVGGLLAHVVDDTFDFDDQFVLQAAEVGNVRADRVLAPEFQAGRS